jgi:hypothetical protein
MDEKLMVSDVLKKRGTGYKAVVTCDLLDFKMICEVKHETLNSKDIKAQHKVIFRDSAGREVARKYVGAKKELKWLTESGEEAQGGIVQAYQKQGESEVVVAPFEKTENIKIIKTAPREIKDDFLVERTIEIWAEEQVELFRFADYLCKNGKVGLASFNTTKGYDTQYLLLIEARIVDESKFGLIGYLTRKHIVFNHLMDLSAQARVSKVKAKGLELVEGIL